MNDFSKKLHVLRTAASLTQTEMAEKLDIPLRTYQNYEAGKFYPKSTSVYAKIAKAFGITVDELLGSGTPVTNDESDAFQAKRQATELLETAGGLFAGAALSEEDKDIVMKALSDAYWNAKLKRTRDTEKKK